MDQPSSPLPIVVALVAALGLSGCTPEIGDGCRLSTDCSIRGDRSCDTSQPGGYCTVLNCGRNSCPDEAACVLFHSRLPGCAVNDRVVSRVGRSYCMKWCESDSDCRGGYLCRHPGEPPWEASTLDDNQSKRVCVPAPGATPAAPEDDAPVCRAAAPETADIDASPAVVVPYAPRGGSEDGGVDGGLDGGADAGVDGGDAGP